MGCGISNQRIVEMDVIRALAIIAVVLIHISGIALYIAEVNSYIYKIYIAVNQLSRFSVPVFIMLSGTGLIITYRKKSYINFISRRLYKTVPRYLVWCFIYIFFITKTFDLHKVYNDIILGNVFYHLYFVPLIIQFYIVFPMVYKFIGMKWSLLITFLITCGILLALHYYSLSNNIQWFFGKKNMLDWIFYFSFGAFIGRNIEAFKKIMLKYRWIISIAFFIVTYVLIRESILNTQLGRDIDYSTTFLRPSVAIYTIFFVLFIFSVNWNKSLLIKPILYISKNSYGIYLSHAFILYFYIQYYTSRSMSINSLGFGIKAFLVTFIGSIVINESRKLP